MHDIERLNGCHRKRPGDTSEDDAVDVNEEAAAFERPQSPTIEPWPYPPSAQDGVKSGRIGRELSLDAGVDVPRVDAARVAVRHERDLFVTRDQGR